MSPSQEVQVSDLTEIKITLVKILANQEHFLEKFEAHVAEDKELAKRLASLETWATRAMGAFGALIVVWGLISHKFLELLGIK